MSSKSEEKVIWKEYSESGDRLMPVTLIRYQNGSIDLHCQTGDHHTKAIAKAEEILRRSGFKIKDVNDYEVYPTGAYYSVVSN